MSTIDKTFSIDDIAIEILSRLSVKDLAAGKCISKRWNDIISNPLFLRAHSERSAAISGLLFIRCKFVNGCRCPDIAYFSFDMGNMFLKTFLDFLPEEVELMDSSNGVVCCRSSIVTQNNSTLGKRSRNGITVNEKVISPEEVEIYVCNPTSRKWTSLRSKSCDIGNSIGIAFFPFGSSQNNFPVYKLVSITKSETKPIHYSFTVYSSETNMWEKSKEICQCKLVIFTHRTFSVGERFFWFAQKHHIVAFDVERELSSVIKLPDPVLKGRCLVEGCLGSSNGYLHYVFVNCSEITVWTLTDYLKSEWLLKHRLSMLEFYEACIKQSLSKGFHEDILSAQSINDIDHFNVLVPVAFHEDVLYVQVLSWICSYCWKTNQLRIICITPENERMPFTQRFYPYTDNLVAASLFNGLGS